MILIDLLGGAVIHFSAEFCVSLEAELSDKADDGSVADADLLSQGGRGQKSDGIHMSQNVFGNFFFRFG